MNLYILFPLTTNNDLLKLGFVPYYLARNFDYNSTFINFNNDDYSYLENDLSELNMDIIERKYPFDFLNIIRYLRKNAKNIDILQCFHYSIPTFTYFFIYKLFNRKGKIYFKIDTDYNTALRLNGFKKGLRYKFETKMSIFLFKHLIDFASIETKKAQNVFLESHNIYKEKMYYLPCTVNLDTEIKKEKKNIIISVGRIGSHQKASEIVLEAFKKVKTQTDNDWILKMVGPISEQFHEYIKQFFKDNPKLKESIIFTGNIIDRNELFEIFAEAKIFCLPSRYGSFEIVFTEALFYEDYLLVSDVGIGKYLVDNTNFGQIVEIDDVEDISKKMIEAIENYDANVHNTNMDFKKYINDEFSPEKYAKLIDGEFRKLFK
ncbi:glycosyltransferase family 4 protein [uncultured Methanobrevibacter sp.]|uniref:glycosyltransferase family 4 protein n=1 Tax=uncultured Methanobrevibacter sp. TaxID=253161 RepID=UPI0025F90D58|nr:glycosyltransferase family 4 protein [uncultured Methanobrevibacter sp.]